MVNFLALSPRAQAYLQGLETKQLNARVHLRKILALAELHGTQAVVRALDLQHGEISRKEQRSSWPRPEADGQSSEMKPALLSKTRS